MGKALRVAGIKIGIGENVLVAGDLALELVDSLRQQVVVALVGSRIE